MMVAEENAEHECLALVYVLDEGDSLLSDVNLVEQTGLLVEASVYTDFSARAGMPSSSPVVEPIASLPA